MDLLEKFKKAEMREEYLKLRLQINELDSFHHLNELEIKGIRKGDIVYIKNKAIYSCEVKEIMKKKCRVKILDKGTKHDHKLDLAFGRIHKDPSEIGLNKYYTPRT